MLYTNPILGGITILVTPLLTFLSKTIMKKGRKAYTQQQRNLGMINGFTKETISGQKVVKVFNHEEIACDEFAYLNDKLCRSQELAQFRSGIMGPVTHQLCNMIYALSACVGGVLVVTGGFDLGGLTVSLNYTRQFNRPINEVSMQMNTVFAALAGAERVLEVLDASSEKPDSDTVPMKKIEGHIVLDHANFGYTPDIYGKTSVTEDLMQPTKRWLKRQRLLLHIPLSNSWKTAMTLFWKIMVPICPRASASFLISPGQPFPKHRS